MSNNTAILTFDLVIEENALKRRKALHTATITSKRTRCHLIWWRYLIRYMWWWCWISMNTLIFLRTLTYEISRKRSRSSWFADPWLSIDIFEVAGSLDYVCKKYVFDFEKLPLGNGWSKADNKLIFMSVVELFNELAIDGGVSEFGEILIDCLILMLKN